MLKSSFVDSDDVIVGMVGVILGIIVVFVFIIIVIIVIMKRKKVNF